MHASDSRSAVMAINKVVYDVEINKVAYELARCEKFHASDSRRAVIDINQVVYEIGIAKGEYKVVRDIQTRKTDVYKNACFRLQKRSDQK